MGIKIAYEEVRANARILYDDASDRCSASASKARSLEKTTLPGVWRGADADALAAALEEWGREAERLQQDLERLGKKIRNIADQAEENEKRMLAAEQAQASSAAASVSGRTVPGMKMAASILEKWKKK